MAVYAQTISQFKLIWKLCRYYQFTQEHTAEDALSVLSWNVKNRGGVYFTFFWIFLGLCSYITHFLYAEHKNHIHFSIFWKLSPPLRGSKSYVFCDFCPFFAFFEIFAWFCIFLKIYDTVRSKNWQMLRTNWYKIFRKGFMGYSFCKNCLLGTKGAKIAVK